MTVFYILILFPVLFQHIRIKGIDYEKRNQGALLFFFFFLTVLVAFRNNTVGNDTRNYIYLFSKCAKTNWASIGKMQLEIGFVVYMKLVSMVSNDPTFFFTVSACIVSLLIYPTYRRLNTDASLIIAVFCILSTFFLMFSGVRQMLAIAIGFSAYEFARDKKLILFLMAVVLATLFHTSAFMLVFVYPLCHARVTKRWLYILLPVFVVLFIFSRYIFAVLASIMEAHTRFEGEITSTGAYTMIILFALFTAFAFLIPDELLLDDETLGLRNMLLFSFALQLFAPLHSLAMRMNYYYIIFIPLLLPQIEDATDVRFRQIADVGRDVMIAFFITYFFLTATGSGHLHVAPYHFFWETGL